MGVNLLGEITEKTLVSTRVRDGTLQADMSAKWRKGNACSPEDGRAGVKLALTGAYERMDDEWNTCKNARARSHSPTLKWTEVCG